MPVLRKNSSKRTMDVAAIESSIGIDPDQRAALEAVLSRIDLLLGDEAREMELRRRESRRSQLASIEEMILKCILLSSMFFDLIITASRHHTLEAIDAVRDFMVPYAVPAALAAACLAFGFTRTAARRISKGRGEYTPLGDHKPTYYEALRLWESSDIARSIRLVILESGRRLYVSDYECMREAAGLMEQIKDPA